jgi:hypothetical protein
MKTKHIIIFFSVIILVILNITKLSAQSEFLLAGADMPEHKLTNQDSIYWPFIEMPKSRNVIQQIWNKSKDEDYYVQYYKFNSEEEAITTTSFAATSFSMPYVMGSPTGKLIGDFSWVSLDQGAVYFQKGNFGIKIFKPLDLDSEKKIKVSELSDKVLAKVIKSIAPEILNNDVDLLRNRISESAYQNKTKKSADLLTQKGYFKDKSETTKWKGSKDSLKMGLRKQWLTSKSCISIDVIELSDDTEAKNYSESRSALTFSPVCLINSDESIHKTLNEIIKRWGDGNKIQYISVVGQSGKTLIHFYYYNEEGIDIDTFEELIKSTRI